MSEFRIQVEWTRKTPAFEPKTYDRTHQITLSGGFSYQATSAPDYGGRPDLVNPEETLLAALGSCHMLTFLAIAANSKLVVDRYEDTVHAQLEKNDKGKMSIKRIIIQPRVTFGQGKTPTLEELQRLHHKAHDNCIVANSILADIIIEPR